MDAIRFLKQEHEQAKEMFAKIQAARGEQRGQLWEKLKPELAQHEQMEEAALYGPLAHEPQADEDLKEWNEHHRDEVAELEALVEDIGQLDPTTDDWMDKIDELSETLEHHIQAEEDDIWPRIQERWDRSRLEQAGERMEAMKRQGLRPAA